MTCCPKLTKSDKPLSLRIAYGKNDDVQDDDVFDVKVSSFGPRIFLDFRMMVVRHCGFPNFGKFSHSTVITLMILHPRTKFRESEKQPKTMFSSTASVGHLEFKNLNFA